jgi:hypothetical protein
MGRYMSSLPGFVGKVTYNGICQCKPKVDDALKTQHLHACCVAAPASHDAVRWATPEILDLLGQCFEGVPFLVPAMPGDPCQSGSKTCQSA